MSLIFERGRCCLGVKCIHPDGELRPSHKCPICHKIVHTQCGIFSNTNDKVVCNNCVVEDSDTTEDEKSVGDVDLTGDTCRPIREKNDVITDMTVSVEPMVEEFTTITESVAANEIKVIPKDYFVTKSQQVNKTMKQADSLWGVLKIKVQSLIDSELKDRMVIEAQKLKLKYGKQDQNFLVENFSEIGKSWKMDGSVENAQKINKIIHGTFDSSQGYKYYIEKDIMNKLKLKYSPDIKGRGSIATLITRRKADLAKLVMKRSAMTHDTKIAKKRTHEEAMQEGTNKAKTKYSFQIKSNSGNKWYNCDGTEYSGKVICKEETENEAILKQRIHELENRLKAEVKVLPVFHFP